MAGSLIYIAPIAANNHHVGLYELHEPKAYPDPGLCNHEQDCNNYTMGS